MTSIQSNLDNMLKRSLTLCGYDLNEKGEKVGKHEAVQNFLKTLAADSTSDKEMADKMIAAWDDKSGTLQRALNAVRLTQIGNFIASDSVFKSAFFSTVTLAPEDQPFYLNESANETRVSLMGDDGSPESVRVVAPQERTAVGLYTVAPDAVRIKTEDIYRGTSVRAAALRTLNIARDIAYMLDRKHYTLLNTAVSGGGCFGAFSYESGAFTNKAKHIYVAHSGIITSQLPTTNAITNGTTAGPTGTRFTVRRYDAASTTLTGFRPAVLRCIVDYSVSWSKWMPDANGQQLVPTGEIIVPAVDIIGIADNLASANTDTANSLNQQVTDSGYFSLSLLGKVWKFIPDITIATGTCYPRFNMLPGLTYEKPSWDKAGTVVNERENWEEFWSRKAYGAVIPAQWRPRAMKITYAAD